VAIAFKKAWDAANDFATFQAQRDILSGLAAAYEETADSIVASISKASLGMISLADALASAAVTIANIRGMGVAEAMGQLTQGIGQLQLRALQAGVGLIDLNAELGEAAKGMTRTQQKAATFEIVMERVSKMQEQTANTSWNLDVALNQLGTTWDNAKLSATEFVTRGLLRVLSATAWLSAGVMNLVGVYSLLESKYISLKVAALEFSGADIWASSMLERLKSMAQSLEDAADASFKRAEALKDSATRTATLALADFDSVSANNAATKAINDRAEATRNLQAEQEKLTALMTEEESRLTRLQDVWVEYRDVLVSVRRDAITQLTDAIKKYDDFLSKSARQQATYADLQRQLRRRTMTDEEKYFDDWQNLQDKRTAAEALSGQARIDALEAWQKERVGILEQTIAREAGGDETAIRRLAEEASRDIADVEVLKEWTRGDIQRAQEDTIASLQDTVRGLTRDLEDAAFASGMLNAAVEELARLSEAPHKFEFIIDWESVQQQTTWLQDRLGELESQAVISMVDEEGKPILTEVERVRQQINTLGETPVVIPVEYRVNVTGAGIKEVDEKLADLKRAKRSRFAEVQ
jgi:hypothetical protein